ncbi:hypothetical protein SAMN02745121_08649 [Nannocystis exedens]|uniref:Uncharacterized protein n=1 Tax=Nannocystis exedens TaxID=54 RepID=A0A1I2IE06_9BACT|nr:hypothetical protein [Nannocystis exedens]PCC67008.1 hypothetical protein NAEX_00011 [Nannocystis exedens]SFF40579.1 hypothetical protein SAMN02745121_08649 [Nannocystis exedens]
MHSRNVEIKSPCHESWDAMHGDDERRFCDVCAKHVHNLSAMTRQAASDLLRAHKGEHLCVRYSNQEDGQIAFRDTVPVSRLRPVRTAFAAMLLAACTPHGDGPPIQDIGDIAIEAMARDAKPSPEGGCEVQTGPFTTMHFPAGHEVCKHVVDLGAQIRPPQPPPVPAVTVATMGAAPIVVEPPPPPPATEELMGKVAPVEHAKMGEAMPEVKEPCDPQPGFAPPPPQMGQAPVKPVEPPKSEPLMGDVVADVPPPPPEREPVRMGRMAPAKTGKVMVDDDL